jgi:hypothetical protein
MSTIAEIQEAIEKLPANEESALAAWLQSQEEPIISKGREGSACASGQGCCRAGCRQRRSHRTRPRRNPWMGWKIIFAPQALEELEQIVRFIAQDDPQAAIRFGDYLVDRAESLANFPELGTPC